MGVWFWIAVILTSPFWMVLGIVICFYVFVLLIALLTFIAALIDEFFKLIGKIFKRRKR